MMDKLIKIFWAEVVTFALIIVSMVVSPVNEKVMSLPFILIAGGVLFILGSILSWKVYHKPRKKLIDKFLFACGASAAGILPAVILHNLIYALLVFLFGKGVGDEPVFFLASTIILPVIFVVGVIGVIYNLFKKHEEN